VPKLSRKETCLKRITATFLASGWLDISKMTASLELIVLSIIITVIADVIKVLCGGFQCISVLTTLD